MLIVLERPEPTKYEKHVRTWVAEHESRRGLTVTMAASGELELQIMDVLGGGFWSGGVTAQDVKYQLDRNPNAKSIRVLVDSPGGDVFEGLAIQALLKRASQDVTAEVLGEASSAASVAIMGANRIVMHTGAMMMVHRAATVSRGFSDQLRADADTLDKMTGNIVDLYVARTGKAQDEVRKMVDAETWMTAAEAVANGFADEVSPAKTKPAPAAPAYKNEGERRIENRAVPYHEYPKREDSSWDGAAAEARMRTWASSDGSGDAHTIDWAKYRNGFAWYDQGASNTFGAYKLPHHDVVDGELVTSRAGTIAAGNAVSGSRGGTSIPASDLPGVRGHLAKHYAQFAMQAPWEKKSNEGVAPRLTNINRATRPRT